MKNVMPSKTKDDLQSATVFVSEQGEPLRFYLRPGPMKQDLLPLITAGGGLLSNSQKPGTILLKDPEERESIRESTAHWYVSTKYIQDCVEKNEKLNIEEYRLNLKSPNSAKRKSKSKVGSPAISGGRSAFTPEEDEDILRYVSKRVKEIGGNRLWQEMAKQRVTSHSWQSMKYRYRVQLAHRLPEYKQADTEQENKTENTDQNDRTSSPQNISVELEDPEQMEAEMNLTLSSSSKEEHTDAQLTECHDLDSMETSTSEIDETPEQLQPAQKGGSTETTETLNPDDKASLNMANRPVTRQQFELENIPYVKKLRSGTSPASLLKRPQLLNKPKSVSSPKNVPKETQAPPKKVRRKTESNLAEQSPEECEQNHPPEMTEADEGSSIPQPPEKRAKRKLGILEKATREFEDDSESDSDLQYETPGTSTAIEAVVGSSNSVALFTATSENQEKEESEQNPQPTAVSATDAAPDAAGSSDPVVPELTTRGDPPLIEQVPSKAHLFIFESESQELEEDSQPVAGPSTSTAVHANGHQTSPSLTQDQLEEDVQLLKEVMKQTNQDLVSVTKALLKASGDVVLAHQILQNPSLFSGPVWTRTDDQRLFATDMDARQDLLNKYGEESVAKRIMFLEMEG